MKLKGVYPQKGLFLWTGLHKAGMASDKQMLWQTESDKLAECLCESAIKNFPGRRIRTEMSDGDRDWEEDFYILRKSWCQAVFTENFFMDNHFDIEYLQSRAGKQAVVDTHVEGIVEWLEGALI